MALHMITKLTADRTADSVMRIGQCYIMEPSLTLLLLLLVVMETKTLRSLWMQRQKLFHVSKNSFWKQLFLLPVKQ